VCVFMLMCERGDRKVCVCVYVDKDTIFKYFWGARQGPKSPTVLVATVMCFSFGVKGRVFI